MIAASTYLPSARWSTIALSSIHGEFLKGNAPGMQVRIGHCIEAELSQPVARFRGERPRKMRTAVWQRSWLPRMTLLSEKRSMAW